MTQSGRNIISVRIRGLAFRCASGSRREEVLLMLQRLDETPFGYVPLVLASGLVGVILSLAVQWWLA